MAELTPNEIADYPLRTGVRGYRVEQVDALLDRVADRIEALERQLTDTRGRLEVAQQRAEETSATEATLKRTLVTAQRAAEETVAEARTEAATLRADAEQDADRLRTDARAEAEELRARAVDALRRAEEEADAVRREAEQRVAHLREVADAFRQRLADHLEAHRALLDGAPAPHELDAVLPDRAVGDDASEGLPAAAGQEGALFAANGPVEGPNGPDEDFTG